MASAAQINGPVVLSGSILCAVLGSVHAFSVFLEPMEQMFQISRGNASLTYSIALICLTTAVLFGHLVFDKVRPAQFVVLVCLLGAAGGVVAGLSSSLLLVWTGYCLLFGTANGLGYAFSLQLSAQASPGREGLAMGIITASYAFGATVAPGLFSITLANGGFRMSMFAVAAALLLVLPVSAFLIQRSGVQFRLAERTESPQSVGARSLSLLWIIYGAGVTSGLLVIGHAAGIAAVDGLYHSPWIAPVIVAFFNMAGSSLGGALADRVRLRDLLAVFPLLTTIGLLSLYFLQTAPGVFLGLSLVGFAYGALISVFPAAITKTFGAGPGVAIYGKVFTAWGTAGLLGPWLAGTLFDRHGDYRAAFLVAIALSMVSLVGVLRFFPHKDRHGEAK